MAITLLLSVAERGGGDARSTIFAVAATS